MTSGISVRLPLSPDQKMVWDDLVRETRRLRLLQAAPGLSVTGMDARRVAKRMQQMRDESHIIIAALETEMLALESVKVAS